MDKKLRKTELNLYHYEGVKKVAGAHSKITGDVSDLLTGNVSDLTGNVSGIRGDVSGIRGDVSGIKGNVDLCKITDAERRIGIIIMDLIEEETGQ